MARPVRVQSIVRITYSDGTVVLNQTAPQEITPALNQTIDEAVESKLVLHCTTLREAFRKAGSAALYKKAKDNARLMRQRSKRKRPITPPGA